MPVRTARQASAVPVRPWPPRVPFFRDEKSRAIGLPTGVANKACRFRLLLDAYGIERDLDIVRAGIDRARHMLEQQLQFAARVPHGRSSSGRAAPELIALMWQPVLPGGGTERRRPASAVKDPVKGRVSAGSQGGP
jgi:hypothetical protein